MASSFAIVVVGPIIEEILAESSFSSSFENATRSSWFPVIITGVMFGMARKLYIRCVYGNLWHDPSLLHEEVQIAGVCCICTRH